LLALGFRVLPRERWQVLATVPVMKDRDGRWKGVNLTYYGLLSATAYVIAALALLSLSAAAGLSPSTTMLATIVVLAVCVPASRIMARIIERKPCTFTVAGAFAVGLVTAPGAVVLLNPLCDRLGCARIEVVPVLAAMAIAYALGEGMGRLACVSFGCCYGKPIEELSPWLRAVFSRFYFRFLGETKKIAYASGLEGHKVVPIQALTAIVHVGGALLATFLFLRSRFVDALVLTVVATQLWRAISELLRADYRGDRGVYQWLSLLSAFAALASGCFIADPPLRVHLGAGVAALWDPIVVVFAEVLWVAIFLYTGRSEVIEASVDLRVCKHRV
jgi:hypothetical protein